MENCYKCGKPYSKTVICGECGIIPIIESDLKEQDKKIDRMRFIIRSLINELPPQRKEFYLNSIKDMNIM